MKLLRRVCLPRVPGTLALVYHPCLRVCFRMGIRTRHLYTPFRVLRFQHQRVVADVQVGRRGREDGARAVCRGKGLPACR